ncbi:MAG: hypothetical protein V8T12_03670 [Parabacteroides johnsonii]
MLYEESQLNSRLLRTNIRLPDVIVIYQSQYNRLPSINRFLQGELTFPARGTDVSCKGN